MPNTWTSKGPFTHSNENVVIEASWTFHRSFIEFFVVMHKIFDEIYLSYCFNYCIKLSKSAAPSNNLKERSKPILGVILILKIRA